MAAERRVASPSGTGHDTARLLGHKPEDVCFEDGKWSIICECAWECWDQPDEERAWDFYNTHVEDDVHTALDLQREKAKAVTRVYE